MPLSGTFDTVPLPELLQWLQQTGKSGTLSITVDTEDTYLLITKGDVAAVGSSDPLRLDMAQLLLARELISEAQYKKALELTGPKKSMCQALVEIEAMASPALARFQSEHLFELVMELFFAEQGSFRFAPKNSSVGLLGAPEIADSNFFVQPIATQSILLESMKRVDDWKRFRRVFASPLAVVRANFKEEQAAEIPAIVKKLIATEEGLSVGELCLRTGFSLYEAYSQLHRAHEAGLVRVDHVERQTAGQLEGLLTNARLLMDEEQYDEAREILATLDNLSPTPEVDQLIEALQTAQLQQLYRMFPPHRSLRLKVSMEELESTGLSRREKYMAARLHGQLDVATLVISTPMGELDTLRILRKLLHAELVELVG